MPHILVADQDEDLAHSVGAMLRQNGFQVSLVFNHRDALNLLSRQNPDLLLLDAVLPDIGGFELCRRIRRSSEIPVLFYSRQARVEDRVLGLQIGADDYVARPCPDSELLARMKAVMRRAERARQVPTTPLQRGDIMLDPVRQVSVRPDGQTVSLTPREVHLLSYLMKRSGRVCTTAQIARHVWGFGGQQTRSIVATSVWRLRAKLECDPQQPRHILTIRNLGYKFEA